MNLISQDIVITLIHSLWQSFLLFVFFSLYLRFKNSIQPEKLRFLSISLLFSQVVISFFTFLGLRQMAIIDPLIKFFSFSGNAFFKFEKAEVILECYIFIFILIQLRSYVKWKSFHWNLTKSLIYPDEKFMALASKHITRPNANSKISFYFHEKIGSPMTLGFWKPIIIFPVALVNQLNMEETESLILHELQHIKNNDFIIMRLIELIANLYFFNPFIYLLKKNAESFMELSCDHAVLNKKKDMISYATALQKTAVFSFSNLSFGAVNAVGNKGKIIYRLSQFPSLIKKTPESAPSAWALFPTILILFFMSFFYQNKPVSFISKPQITSIITNKKNNQASAEQFPVPIPRNEMKTKSTFLDKSDKEQSDIFQSSPNSQSAWTNFQLEKTSKQLTIEEENSETGIRTTSSFLIMDENGILQNTWLWSVEETIETTDSIYSDTLVQFHEYVEDLR